MHWCGDRRYFLSMKILAEYGRRILDKLSEALQVFQVKSECSIVYKTF